MMGIGGEVEMVYSNIAALAEVFKGNGAANSCCATCYGGGFRGEEIEWHYAVCLMI